jgi:hypothetical protein
MTSGYGVDRTCPVIGVVRDHPVSFRVSIGRSSSVDIGAQDTPETLIADTRQTSADIGPGSGICPSQALYRQMFQRMIRETNGVESFSEARTVSEWSMLG